MYYRIEEEVQASMGKSYQRVKVEEKRTEQLEQLVHQSRSLNASLIHNLEDIRMPSRKSFRFLAVKKGRKPGIYRTWQECANQVNGYSGAVYKGFHTLADAEAFLKDERPEVTNPEPVSKNDSRPTKQVIIYTDGASIGNPGPGGYAAVMIYGKHRKEVKGGFRLTTNNRMEIMAALVGLGMLRTRCTVALYTDSQYLVDAITKGWAKRWRRNGWKTIEGKPVANSDLWQQLLEQYDKHMVHFEWIRGHSGTQENERCDQVSAEMAWSKNLPADAGYEKQFDEKPLNVFGECSVVMKAPGNNQGLQ